MNKISNSDGKALISLKFHQVQGKSKRGFLRGSLEIARQSAAAAKSLQSCLTLSDPMDYSLPGSSAHGIFQARVLEWGAIAFSAILDNLI